MSSYKGHTLFALIISTILFQNPLLIALSITGANIPDFDHDFNKENVYKIIILGLATFIILYILKLPSYIGLIIVMLGIILYFSKHRSFTHSLIGILTLTLLTSLIMIWGYKLISAVSPVKNSYLIITGLIILLSFIFINRKVLMIFIPLLVISTILIPQTHITYFKIAFALFTGLFSHTVLDSFTPSGVKLLAPISSKKFYKKFGIAMIILLIPICLIYNIELVKIAAGFLNINI